MKLENTLLSTIVLSAALFAGAVDRSKFRTCDDTGFCKKFRHYEKQEREVCDEILFAFCYEYIIMPLF